MMQNGALVIEQVFFMTMKMYEHVVCFKSINNRKKIHQDHENAVIEFQHH